MRSGHERANKSVERFPRSNLPSRKCPDYSFRLVALRVSPSSEVLVFQSSSIAGYFRRFPGIDLGIPSAYRRGGQAASTKCHSRGTCVAVAHTTQSNRASRPHGATTRVHSAARGYGRGRAGRSSRSARPSGGPDGLTQKRVGSRLRRRW